MISGVIQPDSGQNNDSFWAAGVCRGIPNFLSKTYIVGTR